MASTNLPFVSSNIPPDLRQFLERVRETLSGDTFVRRVDYLGGTVPRNPGEPPGPGPNPIPLPCGSPVTPTAPTGFQVFPGFSGFLLQWDMPEYCGHDRTEVYGLRHDGVSDDLTVKNMLGESKGVLYSHVVQRPGDYWCFWIKHVNVNDVEGPFVAASKCGRTALDPGVLLDSLKKQITDSELYSELGDRINLIDLPGTGLVAQTQWLHDKYTDLASRTTEVSVVSGNRVWMTSSTPAEGELCFYNGGVRPELVTQATCEAYGGTWGSYKHREGDYWYDRSTGYGAPTGNESHTLKKWVSGAWTTGTSSALTKAEKAPSGVNETFWYDSSTHSDSLASKWFMYLNGAWRTIVDEFVNRVADAKVVDQEVARVGYCVDETVSGSPVATDYVTRESCEEQTGHVWYPNLPWATAVKQVSINTIDKCFISGGSYTKFCKMTAYTTKAACEAAGGTWAVYGTNCVRYDIENSTDCAAAGGTWSNYNETNCPALHDENNKVGTWVPGGSSAVEQRMQALQDTTGSLLGMYTLKIDVGGHVAGFGLSNEVMADGTQISRFLIRADQFGVAGDTYASDVEPTHAKEVWLYPGFTWYDQTPTEKKNKYWKVGGAGSWSATIPPFLTQSTAPTTFRYLYRVWKDSDDSVIRYFNGTSFSTSRPAAIESATAPANPFYGQAWWDTSGAGALKIYTFPVSWSTDSADASIPFVVQTTPTTDGAIPVPAGVYMDAAYIKDATITTAKIKDLAVDNAKILDLSADKITAGTIGAHTIVMNGATSIIRSSNWDGSTEGWRIDGSGRAWFYQMDARGGNITGNLGVTGTLTMGTSGSPSSGTMKSWDYSPGSTGWMIQGDGAEFGTLHLRNGAVSTMGYKEVAGPLSSLGRNTWVNSHAYVKGNIVWYSSKTSLYYCYVDHTSDTATGKIPTNTSYWVPFNDPDLTSQWSSSTNYGLGTKCWIESTGLVYVSIAASNTNHVPPNSTYWAQLTHFKSLAVTDEIDLSLGNSSLGAIIIGRFLASTTMATGTIPYDRVITDPDFHIRLMFRETGGDRKLLATSGYHMHCVGKTSGGDYQYEAQICDLTRMEGAKKGKVELLLAASMGSTDYDVSTSSIALVHQGLKR